MQQKLRKTESMGRRDLLAAKVIFAAMAEMAQAGGTDDIAKLRKQIEKNLHLDAWDTVVLPHGKTRWCSALERYSHEYVKAKLITKDRGRWSITLEGMRALDGDALTTFKNVRAAYSLWKRKNPTSKSLH
jgi:hypothetical protein